MQHRNKMTYNSTKNNKNTKPPVKQSRKKRNLHQNLNQHAKCINAVYYFVLILCTLLVNEHYQISFVNYKLIINIDLIINFN